MKRNILVLFSFGMMALGCSKPETGSVPALIPAPAAIRMMPGHLVMDGNSRIRIRIAPEASFTHPGEYRLRVTPKAVRIEAGDSLGAFYAIQSLRQIAPVDSYGKFCTDSSPVRIPALEIRDYPRFGWRGLMLDCSRTFLPVGYLKKTIDRMVMYKMNVLHLHLTDDQGWRVEIRKYPDLTNDCSRFSSRFPDETGGFYTQAELRDLVAYAQERHVTIVPEIEMPGHSSEVFAAYPELSCRRVKSEIFPFFSGPGITDDIYCAGNDSVFAFLENVLDEVMEIFPSAYIHLGGDEAPKVRWKECPACQSRIRKENLADEAELQSYFIRRITAYVHSKGRKVIGWDEILEGGLADGAAVMSWRGTEGGIKAAELGHPVVMSPTSHCYFDYSYETTPVEKVYAFEPIPPGLDPAKASLILGGQANLWTHIDRTESRMDMQIYPRLIALSEALWSQPNVKNYPDFHARLAHELNRLTSMNIPFFKDSRGH
jgi:hexosaminidase